MVFSQIVSSVLEQSHYVREGVGEHEMIQQNYRPISLLPVFSKTFEKVMLFRLNSFLTSKIFFHDFKFDFRANYSTEHACAVLLNYLHSALDSLLISAPLFLDVRKAFDSLTHSVLLFNYLVLFSILV